MRDTPAGTIVYDDAPDINYDPANDARRGKALGAARPADHHAPDRRVASGFGQAVARTMLETAGPPAKHPWMTVELMEREFAVDAYQRDKVQVFLDSVKEAS